MRVAVDARIRANHDLVGSLVRDGFGGVDADGVEVRVEPAGRASRSFAGRAYSSVPKGARAAPGVLYLVRLFVPVAPRDRGFPRTYRYRRLRSAPAITVGSWREALVALAAHEACHVRQFRDRLRRSEIDAERWSKRVLATWSAGDSEPPYVVIPMNQASRPVQLTLALP